MTEKLYYQDAYIKDFTARGMHQSQDDAGNWYVVLSESYFYPTGGGQPHDTGLLNGIPVINVEEIDGEIRHYVGKKLEQIDDVIGTINWERRFDHMQQHAGQHILTAAFVEKFKIETVSFHLGMETCTIDLNIEKLTSEMVQSVENRANEILRENRPIEIKWVTKEEAIQFNLRKELSVTEDIRLVIIPDYDYNGCGGTHPHSTSEVSSIKVLDWEKQKGCIRVRFVCGNRVLKQLHKKHAILLELSKQLSSPEGEMRFAVQKLLKSNKELGKTIEELNEQVLQNEARELIATAVEWNGEKVVTKIFHSRTIKQLQKLAKIIINQSQRLNVFFITENDNLLQIVCVRGPLSAINMNSLVKKVLPLINGKGGGSDFSAQGGGEAIISSEELLAHIENFIQDHKS